MAHLRAYLKISLKLLCVRSGTSLSFPCRLFLLGIGQHSSHIVSQDTGFVSRCQIPVSQQVSEIPSFQTSIGFLCTFFFFFLARSFFESPSHASLFNHVSVKNISTYFSGKALLSLFFKVRAAYCCVCVLHCLKLLSTPSLFLLVDYLSN